MSRPPLVRILKYWPYPNLLRQTPGGQGVWDGIRFVVDEPGEADYVVVHGHLGDPKYVKCPRGHVWLVMGEAPHEAAEGWHDVPHSIDRVYMTDARRADAKHVLNYAFLPWWVDRDYDFLARCPPCPKSLPLSWITSNLAILPGHRYRLSFLEKVAGMEELSLFGRGLRPLDGKWEGLAPYRYSIAFENYSNSHYWSEKVADCFLAWTMPIYYGCTDLSRFFPRESYIQLDPDVADPVAFLRDVVRSDARERNLDAIREARRRVLEDHNLFNVLAAEIRANDRKYNGRPPRRVARFLFDHTVSPAQAAKREVRRLLGPLRSAIKFR